MATSTVRVHGLRETVRGFSRASSELRGEFRDELRQLGELVADDARSIAADKRLRDSGALIGGIRVALRGHRVFVRSTAKRKGYPYPRIYEYARDRPFLLPALDRRRGDVERGIQDAIERVLTRSGLGG